MDAQNRAAVNLNVALVLIFSLFGVWAFGHRLYDALLPQFVRVFALQDYQQAAAQALRSIVYFFGVIPAALYARRFGYKATILLGLGMFCLGAFLLYPAAETRQCEYFFVAAIVMSGGWAVLEIGANPLVVALGSSRYAVQRLNLAQALYMPGAALGLLLGRWLLESNLALPTAKLAHAVVHPYIVLGAVLAVLAYLIEGTKFPAVAGDRRRGLVAVGGDFRTLLSLPQIRFAIVAQFFSILAQVGNWMEVVPIYNSAGMPALPVSFLTDVFVWAVALFCIGRFFGTALMMRFSPASVLAAFSFAGLILSLVGAAFGGATAAVAVLAGNLCLSIMWPTILGLAIRNLGPMMKLATALICMGAALGGIAYRFLVLVWTPPAHVTLLVPAISCAAVLVYARWSARHEVAERRPLSQVAPL